MLKFIYLTSSSFSGSTLLAFMMGAHPRIATVGEMTGVIEGSDLDNYECSCGRLLKNCDFWKLVSSQVQEIHKDFSCKNFKTRYIPRGNGFIDRLQFSNLRNNKISDVRDYIYQKVPKYYNYIYNITKRNIDLANAILNITNKDIFFDASKSPAIIKFLKQHLECEFKVIHLVKDGRGVFDSRKRYNPEIPDSKAIVGWTRVNRFAERSLKYIEKKNRYLLLYKDLVTNPEYELTKLCEFIGVEYSPYCLDFRNSDHHIIGNAKMRLGSRTKIYYDEKWRQSLSSEQLKLFDRLAGKINRKYGYSL